MNRRIKSFQTKVCCEGKPDKLKPFRFPVNGLCINKRNGHVGVVGSNGFYHIYDLPTKRREYTNKQRISCSLTKCKFDNSGRIFSFGVSYDLSRGTNNGMFNNKRHQKILLEKL